MNRAFSSVRLKTINEDERIVEGIASTPRPDRASDIVEPLGAQFELPLPFLLDHNSAEAVGQVEWAEVTKTGIRFRARISKIAEPGAAKDLVDKAWSLLKAGLRKHVSIGFRSLDHEPISGGGYRFKSWEWLELSACAIPMQPDARITGLKNAAAPTGGVQHVAKLRRAAPLPVVKLGELDKRVGALMARRSSAPLDLNHVALLTPEAKARHARVEQARREIEARRWRTP